MEFTWKNYKVVSSPLAKDSLSIISVTWHSTNSLKILNVKFWKLTIHMFKLHGVLSSLMKSHADLALPSM